MKNLGRIINSRNSIGADQCEQLGAPPQTIHLVEMTADGFVGVYKPDGEQVGVIYKQHHFLCFIGVFIQNLSYNNPLLVCS